jgi:acyl-coenzyme A thioesterase PaaI-like protein
VVGRVTASHFSMNCLKPAVGRRFVAKGETVRAGRKQIFAKAELFAEDERGERHLVATGETLLVSLDDRAIPAGLNRNPNSPSATHRTVPIACR